MSSHLQDAAADEGAACVAPDAEEIVVVGLTVRNSIPVGEKKHKHSDVSLWSLTSAAAEVRCLDLLVLLADVLSGQSAAAPTALEAGDVPLPVQRQQRLTLLDLLAAAGAVWHGTQDTRGKSESSSSVSSEWWSRRSFQIWAAGRPEAATPVQAAAGTEAAATEA